MPQTRQHIQQTGAQPRQRHSSAPDVGVRLTKEGIECFMDACEAEGRVEGTLKWYRRGLNRLYDDLPEDKTIRRGTLERWREQLVEEGYASSTINSFLSVNNAYLDFVGHREYQLASQLKSETELQPELTRAEYLRLLQTARTLGREKVYLLVKLFGTTGLSVQELSKVTVEAVTEGKLTVTSSRSKQVLKDSGGLTEGATGLRETERIFEGSAVPDSGGDPHEPDLRDHDYSPAVRGGQGPRREGQSPVLETALPEHPERH